MTAAQRPWHDAQHPATDAQRPWIEEPKMPTYRFHCLLCGRLSPPSHEKIHRCGVCGNFANAMPPERADDPGALPFFAQGNHQQTPEGLHCMRCGFSWPCRGALYAELSAARAEAAALRQRLEDGHTALLIYGLHDPTCEVHVQTTAPVDPCSCRYSAAIAALAPPEPAP